MNLKVTIVVAAVVAGVALLVFSTGKQEGALQYQLTEFYENLQSDPEKLEDRNMTLYGYVQEGSIRRNGVEADFVLEQGERSLNVFFTGKTLLPDTFEDGADVSIDGKWDSQKQLFVADKAMAQCGSKYIPKGSEGGAAIHPDEIPRGE